MSEGIYVASAGAVAQSVAMDATANNIANASTGAFQGVRVSFSEALTKARSPDVALVANHGSGVDDTPGAITQTGNALDVALDGPGYLAIDTAQGVRYTRAGALQLDAAGVLRTADGNAVRGAGGGPITIPAGTAQIAVSAEGAIAADGEEVGRLELVRLDPRKVTREGATLLAAKGPPLAEPPPRIIQGALEGSNINVVRGVVDLVKVSRTYESLLRMIEGYSQCESRAARDIGGPK